MRKANDRFPLISQLVKNKQKNKNKAQRANRYH
jgi:hypothetical protein